MRLCLNQKHQSLVSINYDFGLLPFLKIHFIHTSGSVIIFLDWAVFTVCKHIYLHMLPLTNMFLEIFHTSVSPHSVGGTVGRHHGKCLTLNHLCQHV